MEPNPFDDETAPFLVLINEERQYSLWPADTTIPVGWDRALARSSREECLSYIESHWIDMRPASLVAAMESTSD